MRELEANVYLQVEDFTNDDVTTSKGDDDERLQKQLHQMFPYVPSEVRISTEIPPRGHIPALWERIEGEMMSRGAKFNTLCPIRAEEHRKLFDELIRQVLVQSPEQGALLWRVRMESEGSVDTWKELCVCGQNYGNRVYTKIDPNQQTEFIQRCREINGEIDSLERQLIALKARYNFAIRLRDEQIGVEGEELKESQFLETQKKQQFTDLINYMNNYHLDDNIEYTEENMSTFRKLKDIGIHNEKLTLEEN